MRSTLPLLVLLALAACGDDPTPAQPAPRAAALAPHDATSPASSPSVAATGDAQPAATTPAAEQERAAQRTAATVAEILATAARGDARAQGNAPEALKALGDAALPGLATGLAQQDVAQRRIAVLALLSWGKQLPAGSVAITALDQARKDTDPAVAAAAEHAYLRAIGDTSALDRLRAAEEEAVRKRR